MSYAELPPVFDPLAAVAEGAPLLHPESGDSADDAVSIGVRPLAGTNVCHRFRLVHGDGERGFEHADVIVEETFRTAGAQHAPMEPHAALAHWDGGRLELWTGTQTPFNLRSDLAGVFGIEPGAIRVHCPPMGGSFGAKTFVRIEAIAPALARKAGRPVRLVLSRAEEWQTLEPASGDDAMSAWGRAPTGRWTAAEYVCHADTGAYADCGPGVVQEDGVRRAQARTGSRTSRSTRSPSTRTTRRTAPSAATARCSRPGRASARSTCSRRGSGSTRSTSACATCSARASATAPVRRCTTSATRSASRPPRRRSAGATTCAARGLRC